MLRGFWYIPALCIVLSIISVSEGYEWLLVLYCCWILFLWMRKRLSLTVFLLTILIGLAAILYLPPKTPPSAYLPKVSSDPGIFQGKITSPLNEKEKTIEFQFKPQDSTKLLVTYFKEHSNDSLSPTLQHGASCRLKGVEEIPQQATNPHQFDYRNYLWQKNIHSQVILSEPQDIICTDQSVLSYIYTIRQALLNTTEKGLQPDTTSWVHALVLGDDTLLDERVIELFQRWGLSHILAISGLHIGIIVGLLFFCFVRLQLLTKEKTKWFLCLFLPVYALVAGGQPSVWRASLMVLLVILLSMFKRKTSYTDLISITFILLILFDKYIVYHIGFQLSFAVTFGIILSRKWLAASDSSVQAMLRVSFVSQMVILPLQLHYFSVFDPSSILLNLLVIPYFSLFVIPAMFVFLFLSFLPADLVQPFEAVFGFIHGQVIDVLFWIDAHFHFPFIIGKLPLYFTVCYYVLFILLMVVLERKHTKKAFLYGFVLCGYVTFLACRPYLSPYGTVTMLDIGQGDAFVIEMPYRKGVYFVDIGAAVKFPEPERHDKEYNQVIRPYLYGQGIHKVDAVFLSHEHLDHYGSLPYLMEDMQVDDIIISDYYEPAPEQIDAWKQQRARVNIVSSGDVIQHGNLAFHVIGPLKKTNSSDDNSLVLYVEIGNKSWVFTGDIGKETERNIVKTYPNLTADVLKVAHHGSNTSTDPAFAERFKEAALMSLGRNNMYNHPGDEVIDTLEESGLRIYRTDQHGAVQYRFKDERGTFIPFIKSVE